MTAVYVLTECILGWKVNSVGVKKLKEGSIDGIRELV